jgi:hypothetical protein
MENEQKQAPSHEEREAQTLVDRIEQMEVTKQVASEAEGKITGQAFRKSQRSDDSAIQEITGPTFSHRTTSKGDYA